MFVYVTPHVHSETVCRAFAAGGRLPTCPPHRLMPGNVAVYGIMRGCSEIIAQAQNAGRRWLYIDRGYFRASRDKDYGGFFRVTCDDYQHGGLGEYGEERWQRLNIRMSHWRKSGTHIVVCPPGRAFANYRGFCADKWLADVLAKLRASTDRPVRVREKPTDKNQKNIPLGFDLAHAWAVVAHSSNAAVEALLAGVPVFCTAPCAAYLMGRNDVTKIEAPDYPEREGWARALAANQWTLDEMRDGTCWRDLTEFHGTL